MAVFLPLMVPVKDETVLKAGSAVERDLAGGEVHLYRLEGQPGQNLLVTVVQDGINVAITLRKADGSALGKVDSAETRRGYERFLVSFGAEGFYGVEMAARKGAPAGRYKLETRELPASAPEVFAERLMTEADLLVSRDAKEPRRRALELYSEVLQDWRDLGSKADTARTLNRLAVTHHKLGEAQPMLDYLEEALPLVTASQDREGEGEILNGLGLAYIGLSRFRDANASFQRSLEIWRGLADLEREATVSQNICLIRLYLAEWREAILCYEKVIPLMEGVGEPTAEAFNGLGGANSQLGEPRRAQDFYLRSLEQRRALDDQQGEAAILNNLAVLSTDQGALGEALDYYGQVLEVYRKLGDRAAEARILGNQGYAYLASGESQRALDLFEQSLAIRRQVKDRRGEMNTLDNLGLAQEQLGEISKAVQAYEQALKIAREIEDRAGVSSSLNLLAQGSLKSGDPKRALELLSEAVALQRQLGYRSSLALALQRTGEIQTRLGQLETASSNLQEALALNRSMEDRSGQAGSLASLAAAERELGHLDQALAHADEAIRFAESVRATVREPSLRASFLASQQLPFELAIDLRMELHRKQPSKGFAEAGLTLSERARARSLLDLLHETSTVARELDPKLKERREKLAFLFSVNAKRQRSASTDERRASLKRELTDLLGEADRLENEIRLKDPRYAALSQPLDPTSARGLLDPDTLLLEYTLGEKHSFLWAVTSEKIESFVLPGRSEIESMALQAYKALSTPDQLGIKEAEALQSLSHTLLSPIAALLPGKRLVIVADGALQYLPFAVLPAPGEAAGHRSLVTDHEIVSLPSASVLEVQRRLLRGRPPAEKVAAILADPVFTSSDSRIRQLASPAPINSTKASVPSLGLQRLLASGREAKAIAALIRPDQVLTALGVQASRRTALSGDLFHYRFVHFATHGEINSSTPRLSFLALSMFDEQGQAQEGFFGLSDIYNLELRADLVVLSGCETALGREIRGEGLVGLTQGFFAAGAERVMASLWRVEDQATAELMTHFYRGMLQEGKSPAAALRSAQLALQRNPQWQHPFFWAPFILQGDWR